MDPARARRHGFTLFELMVSIVIMAILASTILFALWGVTEQAKGDRTRSQIARLHTLLVPRWEAYKTRRVQLTSNGLQAASQPPAGLPDGRFIPRARLLALRELMRMELPDRKSDLVSAANSTPMNRFNQSLPRLTRTYVRRADAAVRARHGNGADWQDDNTWTLQFQGAECLYLIISSLKEGDETGLEFFTENEVGDVDNDGMREILDGWGRPIGFLRWAPGYLADWSLGNNVAFALPPGTPSAATPQVADDTESPDAFDPLKVAINWANADKLHFPNPYALVPLVYSAGPDGSYDIATDYAAPNGPLVYATIFNNPYFVDSSYDPPNNVDLPPIGTPVDEDGDGQINSADNITNHALEVR